jgi:transcriptional regulator with XRE-family HTH domain
MNTSSPLIAEMKDKKYRDGYVAAQIALGLPSKIRALRAERKWTQGDLARLAKMAQPRISEIETPGERKLNLETLQRIASAFDVGLEVDFVSFGELVDRSEGFDPDSFSAKSFDAELAESQQTDESRKKVAAFGFQALSERLPACTRQFFEAMDRANRMLEANNLKATLSVQSAIGNAEPDVVRRSVSGIIDAAVRAVNPNEQLGRSGQSSLELVPETQQALGAKQELLAASTISKQAAGRVRVRLRQGRHRTSQLQLRLQRRAAAHAR